MNNLLSKLTPQQELLVFNVDVISSAPAACPAVDRAALALDATASSLLSSMQALQLSADLSPLGALTEVDLGADFCRLVTSVYDLYSEAISLSITAAEKLTLVLSDGTIFTARQIDAIQLTRCERSLQTLRAMLSAAYSTSSASDSGGGGGSKRQPQCCAGVLRWWRDYDGCVWWL
jgi:hypothetical protein